MTRNHPKLQIRSFEPKCSPRSALDSSHHATVDSALKDIKLCSRRIQTALQMLSDESRVLERLFYKGKNQHRGALFWRRVADMRTFCRRLVALDLCQLTTALRWAFFDGDSIVIRTAKLPKGSWTRYPDVQFLKRTSRRLKDGVLLLKTMQDRITNAYHALVLILQTGAFLQFILTLVAVSSRMQAVVTETLEGTIAIIDLIARLVDILSLPQASGEVQMSDASETTSVIAADLDFHELIQTASSTMISNQTTGVMIERVKPQNGRRHPDLVKPRKKKKVAKDEIDMIFEM